MSHNLLIDVGLFLSLGLDTLGVAIGLGISGLDNRQQLRFGFSFALTEGIMPLVGLALGSVLARAVGDVASYLAIALLLGIGAYAIWEGTHGEEKTYSAVGLAGLAVLALSVSLDELAVGFSLGLLHVPVVLAVAYIAVQAFIVTLIGTAVGQKLGERMAESAELVSGVALVGLGLFLLGERLAGA